MRICAPLVAPLPQTRGCPERGTAPLSIHGAVRTMSELRRIKGLRDFCAHRQR